MYKINNLFYYWFGLALLFIVKIVHSLKGYYKPRAFKNTEFQKAIEYDFSVFNSWIKFLKSYSPNNADLKDKVVLELGPGAELGIGLIMLTQGAKKYNAIDINNLIYSCPKKFYTKLFDYIQTKKNSKVSIDFLQSQLELTLENKNDKLNYICNKNFDLSIFKNEKIDLVFSHAAFEHFDDIEKTIIDLSKIIKPGGILISEIDLKTHTRWIRDWDPNNIYRYSNFIYNLFHFSGSPNRRRPYEYEKILKENGWGNIQIIPLTTLEKNYLIKINSSFSKQFRDKINQMDYLTIMLCATKK